MVVYLLYNRRNAKCYVGVTHQQKCRWNKQLSDKTNPHLRNAINKYGPGTFVQTTLATCNTIREANRLERFWIRVLQSSNPKFGYNRQFGGYDGAAEHTPEVRKIISDAGLLRWRKTSERKRKKFSFTMRLVWALRTEAERTAIGKKIRRRKRGKTLSPATKEKISQSMKDYWARKREVTTKKPVVGTKSQCDRKRSA